MNFRAAMLIGVVVVATALCTVGAVPVVERDTSSRRPNELHDSLQDMRDSLEEEIRNPVGPGEASDFDFASYEAEDKAAVEDVQAKTGVTRRRRRRRRRRSARACRGYGFRKWGRIKKGGKKFCYCPSGNINKKSNDFRRNCRPCVKGKFLKNVNGKWGCFGVRKWAKFTMRFRNMNQAEFDKKKGDIVKKLAQIMNITEDRIHARLKVSNASKPTPTAQTSAKPNSATTPSTPAAKTSRRLLGLLAVNGQIEDTVGTIFAETFTAERKSIPHPDLARIPADEEIVDLGVFGSGNSEIEIFVEDNGRAGDDLKEGTDKMTSAAAKQLGLELNLGSDGNLEQAAKIKDMPAGTLVPTASAPGLQATSCLVVLVTLVILLNLA